MVAAIDQHRTLAEILMQRVIDAVVDHVEVAQQIGNGAIAAAGQRLRIADLLVDSQFTSRSDGQALQQQLDALVGRGALDQ